MTLEPGAAKMRAMREKIEMTEMPESLGAFVRERAETLGDAILGNWFEDGEAMSYAELDERADRLASSLLAVGGRKNTHVAVMLPNVSAFPVSWVALGRIGAVMIPVNTGYTSEELLFVLSDSDSQFVILDADYLEALARIEDKLPLIENDRVIVHGSAPEGRSSWSDLCEFGTLPFFPPTPVTRGDLLNIQYTSGTTGFPKGCHDYWMLIGHYASEFRSQSGEIRNTLIWAPFFYMDPQWQFLMTMNLGATMHIARRISLSSFYDWLETYEINYCIFPEPALKAREPSDADTRLKLKYVSIYGWRRESREEVECRFGVVAREGYGMTEIGGGTIVPAEAIAKSRELTCGLPAPFRELRIVHENGEDVAEGEEGELWVAGRSILQAYYKRPAANRESFCGRWFRTGDLFRRDTDGYYYIVGRLKDMIKRAGENIAAREVEAALNAMPEIEESAVLPAPDPQRREEVKAYILLKGGDAVPKLDPESIIAHCKERLAAFKIPRYITFVSEFPRTPSRKIRKNLLNGDPDNPAAGAWDRLSGKWH